MTPSGEEPASVARTAEDTSASATRAGVGLLQRPPVPPVLPAGRRPRPSRRVRRLRRARRWRRGGRFAARRWSRLWRGWALAPATIVLGVVALVVAVSAAHASRNGGPSLANAVGTPLWSAPMSSHSDVSGGGWEFDDTFVGGSAAGLTAYRADSGDTVWRLAVPEGGQLCGMSPTISDGIGVFGYQLGDHCDSLAAVDLLTGKMVWHQHVSVTDPALVAGLRFTETGGRLLLAVATQINALNLTTGHSEWTVALPDDCLAYDVGVRGSQAIAVDGCARTQVDAYALSTGRHAWTEPLPDSPDSLTASGAALIATSPYVVRLGDAELAVFTGPGAVVHTIASNGTFGQLAFGDDEPDSGTQPPALLAGDTIVVPAISAGAPDQLDPDELVAFDTADGQVRWTSSSPSNGPVTLAWVSGTSLSALIEDTTTGQVALTDYALATGARTTVQSWYEGEGGTADATVLRDGAVLAAVSGPDASVFAVETSNNRNDASDR